MGKSRTKVKGLPLGLIELLVRDKKSLDSNWPRDKQNLLAILLISALCVLYLMAVLLRHYRLESFGYDLGLYAQEVYLLASHQLPYSTIKIPNMVIWGDHWTPSMVIFAPLVWLFGRADLVLVICQVLFLALAALVVWIISIEKTADKLFSLVLLLSFLIFYGVQNAVFFDAHPFFYAAMLFPLLYWFWQRNKWAEFFLLSFLIANFQENLALYLIALGLCLMIRRRYKQGVFLIIFYGMWFFLIVKLLIPHFSPTGGFLYSQEMPGLVEMVKRLIVPIEKGKVVILSFWNFSFLPLLSSFSLLLSGVTFLENFLGTGALAGRFGFDRHYKAVLGPVLAIGALEAYSILKKRRLNFSYLRWGIIGNMLIAAIFMQYYLHLQLNMLSKKAYWDINSHKQRVLGIIKDLNRQNYSVVTQNNFVPHLSNRQNIYILSYLDERGCHLNTNQAEYVLVDLSDNQSPVNFLGCSVSEISDLLKKGVAGGEYRMVYEEKKIYLLRRSYGAWAR